MNYYNEHDPKAAAWLRELIAANLIAPGIVDERSITEVNADELADFIQCHFFAGIGGWSYALRLAANFDSTRGDDMSETKERPILFSAEMVRAILEGRKTQTRRVIRDTGLYALHPVHGDVVNKRSRTALATQCPFGKPGDHLWVREAWAPCIGGPCEPSNPVLYRADNLPEYEKLTWRPSIFMPRWASRINLEVVSVRVERAQEISEDDAVAEGAHFNDDALTGCADDLNGSFRSAFRHLWDSINAKRGFGWEANPWVWVIEFKRIKP